VTPNGQDHDPKYLRLNISETMCDTELVSMDHL